MAKRTRPCSISARLRRPRSVRLYTPPTEASGQELEAQVDAILAKIAEKGEASLSEAERDVLRTASERYKRHQRQP